MCPTNFRPKRNVAATPGAREEVSFLGQEGEEEVTAAEEGEVTAEAGVKTGETGVLA